jgi:hypothetical protein
LKRFNPVRFVRFLSIACAFIGTFAFVAMPAYAARQYPDAGTQPAR